MAEKSHIGLALHSSSRVVAQCYFASILQGLTLTIILSMKIVPSTDSPSVTPVDDPSVSEVRKTVTWKYVHNLISYLITFLGEDGVC